MNAAHLSLLTLNLYFDAQLDAEKSAAVEAHLASCTQCMRELEALRAVFTALDTLPAERIPVDITPSVLAQIHSTPVRSPLATAILAVQFAFAVLLGVWAAPMLLSPLLPSFPHPDFEPTLNVVTLLSASGIEFGSWLDNFTRAGDLYSRSPLGGIGIFEWLCIVVILGLVWLVSNRWLLNKIEPMQNHREALQ